MILMKWTQELVTGIKAIDYQHREAMIRVNGFLRHCADGNCERRDVIRTFNYLRSYVVEHFGFEEKLMAEYDYPKAERHIKAHRSFRNWVDNTVSQLEKRELTSNFILDLNYHLVEHLERHFRNTDREMTIFLKELAESRRDYKLMQLIKGIFDGPK